MTDTNMLVLGTSIMWGQGLEDADKLHNVLRRRLEGQRLFGSEKIQTIFLAHSGASTGYRRDGSTDTNQKPRVHGEVPTIYPTILQQIDEFDSYGVDPASVRIILLDAGVNDVHVTTILNPLVGSPRIKDLVEIYCHQHMIMLLDKLTIKFPQAMIFVLGYYKMLTKHSEDGYARSILRTIGRVPGGALADFLIALFEAPIKRRLLNNCDTFALRSQEAFVKSATAINDQLVHKRVFVVPSPIDAPHVAFTRDPWVFGIKDDLAPEDPVARERVKACECAGPARTEVIFCKKASAGHPNKKGAQAYAEAILELMSEKLTP